MFGKLTSTKDEQSLKAPSPINVTTVLSSPVSCERDEHPSNAFAPIVASFDLNVTLVSAEQPEKAPSPKVNNVCGNITFVSFVQPEKAPPAIEVTFAL